MHPHSQRIAIAKAVRIAADSLLEASERAHDLQRFQLSGELLDESLHLIHLASELLQLGFQPASAPPEYQEDLPF